MASDTPLLWDGLPLTAIHYIYLYPVMVLLTFCCKYCCVVYENSMHWVIMMYKCYIFCDDE